MMRVLIGTATVAVVLMSVGLRSASAADLVEINMGRDESGALRRGQLIGDIIAERWDEGVTIRYMKSGKPAQRTVPLDLVLSVQRSELPANLSMGLLELRTRKYRDALEHLRLASEDVEKDGPQWAEPYVLFHGGQAAFNEAKYAQVELEQKQKYYDQAQKLFDGMIQKDPSHRFVPDAVLGRGVALTWLGDHAQARAVLEAARDTAGYPRKVRAAAEVWLGRLVAEEGKVDQAVAELVAAREKLMEDYPDLAYQAMLGEAYARQKKGTTAAQREAENLFETVGLRSPEEEVRAEAFNSRGISLKNRGDEREALLSFLRVVVLHRNIPQEHQRALCEAARLSKQYYGDDERAKELADQLHFTYPGSYWDKKLQEDL